MSEQKLRSIMMDILILDDDQYADNLSPYNVSTWDSLAMVEIAAAITREFGCEVRVEETVEIESLADIKALLRSKGIELT